MARRWTFGTDSFGSLVTAVAPHLIGSGQLQVAQNVSHAIAGAAGASNNDLLMHSTGGSAALGLKVLRIGGEVVAMSADQTDIYSNGVSVGASGGNVPHRFVGDSLRAYCFNGYANSVWDGTTLRAFGPFGSDWLNVSNDAETMLVENDDSTPADIAGVYKWAASYRITLASGIVIESKLYPLWIDSGGDPDDNFEGSITLTTSDGVYMWMRQVTQAEVDAWCGDLGAGKVEGVFWRTKAGGVDYWQDAVVSEANIVGNVGRYGQHDTAKDADLGALYVESNNAHEVPPSGANLAVFCQRRLFVAVKGERKLYFSGIDNYDYFDPSDTTDAEDSIEALNVIGESVAVITPSGIRLWSPVDATGQWSNTSSSVGTTHSDGHFMTDRGLMFTREDGVYLFDGVGSKRISEQIDPTWGAGPWKAAYSNGKAYFTNGSLVVEFEIVGGDILWSTRPTSMTDAYSEVSDDHTDGGIWGTDISGDIYKIHGGSGLNTAIRQTKDYGDGNVRHWDRLTVDFEGTLSAVVTTNRGATQTVAFTATNRLRTRTMLGTDMIGELCSVTLTGTGTPYGVELETT